MSAQVNNIFYLQYQDIEQHSCKTKITFNSLFKYLILLHYFLYYNQAWK